MSCSTSAEEIWTRRHFSRGSDKCETGGRTAITRECRKFTTLTLGGARQTGTGDQSEREINKIQIDNEERLSFLIPHSSPAPGLTLSLSRLFSFRGCEYVQIGHLKSVEGLNVICSLSSIDLVFALNLTPIKLPPAKRADDALGFLFAADTPPSHSLYPFHFLSAQHATRPVIRFCRLVLSASLSLSLSVTGPLLAAEAVIQSRSR